MLKTGIMLIAASLAVLALGRTEFGEYQSAIFVLCLTLGSVLVIIAPRTAREDHRHARKTNAKPRQARPVRHEEPELRGRPVRRRHSSEAD